MYKNKDKKSQTVLRKNMGGRFALLGIKTYNHNNNTVWYWHKGKEID